MDGRLSMEAAQLLGTGNVYCEGYCALTSMGLDRESRTDLPLRKHYRKAFCVASQTMRTASGAEDVGCMVVRKAVYKTLGSHFRAKPNVRRSHNGVAVHCIPASVRSRQSRRRACLRGEEVEAVQDR